MKKPARKADEEAPAKEKEIGVKAFLAELDALWKQYQEARAKERRPA